MSFSEWKEVRLSKLTTKIGSGATPKGGKDAYKTAGISLIRSQNILNNEFSYDGLAFIDEEQAKKLDNVKTEENDVLLNITGDSVARCTILPKALIGARVNQHVSIIRTEKSKLNPLFLKYHLVSPYMQSYMLSMAQTGGTRAALTKGMIEDFIIPTPNIEEQKAIASILSTLDDKIELNSQINKNLEEMAQAIFKHWFVDFEFPCLPENYKFSGAGKPCLLKNQQFSESDKPSLLKDQQFSGAGKPSLLKDQQFSGAGKPADLEKVCTYKRVGGLPVPDGESWFVYVLLCNDGSFYKGITTDLYRRFYEHYTGKGAKHTKIHKPIKVIHHEHFNSQEEARKREEELKTGYGREWLKREYNKYLEGGLPAPQTSLRMAGEMVESELGMIPKGWEVNKLGSIIELGYGKALKKEDRIDGNISVYGSNGKVGCHNQYLIKGPGIVVGRKGNPGTVTFVHADFFPIDTTFYVKILNNLSVYYIYYLLKHQNLKLLSADSAVPGLNRNLVYMNNAIVPDKEILKKFDSIISSIFESNYLNEKNINSLYNIRDTLLPKLMSGEIRVPY